MSAKLLSVNAQSQEAEQLLLDWEKLTQFKSILKDMYAGYEILQKGYGTIKDISEGNFSLHKTFLDALMEVSPVVKEYHRVADIVNYQLRIIKQGKSALNKFKQDKNFTGDELEYIGKVYSNLFDQSVKNLDDLLIVITAGELRMSDEERLGAIDKIYASVVDQFSFLKEFSNTTRLLSLGRSYEATEIEMSKKLGGY
jgi:DNA repair ATPase RecN